MELARKGWRLLVALKDALALLFLALFFWAVFAALTYRPATTGFSDGALQLKLNGALVEQPAPVDIFGSLTGQPQMRQFRLRDVVAAIDRARTDDRVKAITLELDGFAGGGQVAINAVGAALDRFRKDKPVLAFATGYDNAGYLLAAHASHVSLDPMGLALVTGPGGENLYYKGLLDRFGVNVHVYRVGTYKSAVEPFILSEQSQPAKQAATELYQALWTSYQQQVAAARPKAQITALATGGPAALGNGSLADAALRLGLVDTLESRDAFRTRVQKIAGEGRTALDYRAIPYAAYIRGHTPPTGNVAGDVGVVTVAGPIVDGEADTGTAGGDTIARAIRQAVAGNKVRALVLRVDSPGGSALASERIREALALARSKGVPVTVSMANVAASGGYWVSTAGERVFAEPATVTGSIGVFGLLPTFEKTLANYGVTTDGVRTTPLSGQPDLAAGTTPEVDALLQRGVESIYGRFLALVAEARRQPVAQVDSIAQGRVWAGERARALGLVDEFGGLDKAIADAARRAELDPASVKVVYLEEPDFFAGFVGDMTADDPNKEEADALSLIGGQRTRALAMAAHDAAVLLSQPSVQARCLECGSVGVWAAREPRDLWMQLMEFFRR